MMDKKQIGFEEIVSPLRPLIEKIGNNIRGDADKYKLSFIPFTLNLLFGIICRIESRAQLITEIQSSDTAEELNLVDASNSMYSESFDRYGSSFFREIFINLLDKLNFMSIPGIDPLGIFMLVDGSIFPAIKSMTWACYKETANALKLHLALNLNLMVPAEFISTAANYSEKEFLRNILKAGITYICDRGYLCFRTFKMICDKGAFFIIRYKENARYTIIEHLEMVLPDNISSWIGKVNDMRIVFKNDKNLDKNGNKMEYRMIVFSALGQIYVLVTNRFDLTTYQIIMLYAYRWQVELIFRFIKRTLNCIHLLSHSPQGIEAQFYLYMISYLLLLSFKQKCVDIADNEGNGRTEEDIQDIERPNEVNNNVGPEGRQYVCGLVSMLGKRLQRYWKIGVHWLIAVKNYLAKPFTMSIAKAIACR